MNCYRSCTYTGWPRGISSWRSGAYLVRGRPVEGFDPQAQGRWSSEFETWAKRSLADREVVYVWADGIYVKAGMERDKAALLVVMGAMRDGTKEVLAVTSGYRESTDRGRRSFGLSRLEASQRRSY